MRYFGQLRCALKSLCGLFAELKEAGIFERSFIVLHGDHGSQVGKHLPDAWNFEKLGWADYRAHFSTLFAVKSPRGSYQAKPDVLPLSVLLQAFAAAAAPAAHGGGVAFELAGPPESPAVLQPCVFLTGTFPLKRIDANIFTN